MKIVKGTKLTVMRRARYAHHGYAPAERTTIKTVVTVEDFGNGRLYVTLAGCKKKLSTGGSIFIGFVISQDRNHMSSEKALYEIHEIS